MDTAGLVAVALSFMGALTCSWALLRPFFDPAEEDREGFEAERRTELALRREHLFGALEDLEVDRISNRVSANDYDDAKRELAGETALVMAELERFDEPLSSPLSKQPKERNGDGRRRRS